VFVLVAALRMLTAAALALLLLTAALMLALVLFVPTFVLVLL